ncbi:MAG: SIR2 family protein [Acidobacteriota bacterium]|nr:SIR2 family protein [Acidobacteriota bacterium]
MLVAASPSDLPEYGLAPVEVNAQIRHVAAGLDGIAHEALASGGAAHLETILEYLRRGFDILYLVCHGAMRRGEPWLWLEAPDGATARVSGKQLAERLGELSILPRLVVLVSCESAGVPAALGPMLAETGVPAVLAMQGKISMETMNRFLPVFFKELNRDGCVDRAVAAARAAVQDRPDWWMPVLFQRLKSGRLWYKPGFSGGSAGMEKWPALIRHIKRGRCTPVLGYGLAEPVFGNRRDLANYWAETYCFPMRPHHRENLPQVAQYLSVNQDAFFPFEEFIDYHEKKLDNNYARVIPDYRGDFSRKLKAVGAYRRGQSGDDPYRVLAEMRVPIYVTADPSALLDHALVAAGSNPKIELCRWSRELEDTRGIFEDDPDFRPSAEEPLIYRLFGSLDHPESLVLTEDNYFDFLIGVTGNNDLIPSPIRRALADSALLFLGFDIDAWDFRVLFRSIMNREGSGRRRRYAHVAVQIDPESSRILSPGRARDYLEEYFGTSDINIYWGSAEDFLSELAGRLRAGGN